MTASSASQAGRSTQSRRGTAATIAIGMISAAAVLGMLVAAVTFLALAIALRIAVPLAQQYQVSFSAADMALAERIGDFWWVFGGLSVGSLLAAAFIGVKAVSHLGSGRHEPDA